MAPIAARLDHARAPARLCLVNGALLLLCVLSMAAVQPRMARAAGGEDASATAAAYSVSRFVIDGGSGSSSGGTYSLRGTAGQLEADPLGPSSGGSYSIDGGFWGDSASDRIFASQFEP